MKFREWNDDPVHLKRDVVYWESVLLPRCREYVEHRNKFHKEKAKKRFAFTFTTNQNTQLEIQKQMCESAYKLFTQETTPVSRGEVYLEYTEAGRPHLHGWYETQDGGRVFAKVFRRCWQYWGEKDRMKMFPGGYHEEMKGERYKAYASSEGRLIISKKEGEEAKFMKETAERWWFINS